MKGEALSAASSEGSPAVGHRAHLGVPCSALPWAGGDQKLQPDETQSQCLWAFWPVERPSLLECGCFMELGVAGWEGCVLSWWQTGSCTKSWFQSGPACWLWLSLPPFVDALFLFFLSLLCTHSLNLESFRKWCSFGVESVSASREGGALWDEEVLWLQQG